MDFGYVLLPLLITPVSACLVHESVECIHSLHGAFILEAMVGLLNHKF